MKIVNISHPHAILDCTETTWPCTSFLVNDARPIINDFVIGSTLYGYVAAGKLQLTPDWVVPQGFAFSLPIQKGQGQMFNVLPGEFNNAGLIWGVIRWGFRGFTSMIEVEAEGRLTYIDGCSDSLLIYPPRKGDGSLNHLHFPPCIDQSMHTHPSIRLGYVQSGRGVAHCQGEQRDLNVGDSFVLNPHERHRFVTTDSHMNIVIYHPDGDWGPEDHNHVMLNRTYKE